MRFELREKDFTPEVASLWGDMLGLGRPATFYEASWEFERSDDFGGNFADYFSPDGSYKGPCALRVSVEDRETAS